MMSGLKGRLIAYIGEDDVLFFNNTFSISLAEDVLRVAKDDKELNSNIRKMFHVKPAVGVIFDVIVDAHYNIYEGSLISSFTGEVIYPEAKMMMSLLGQTSYLIFRSTVVKSEWGGTIVTVISEHEGNTFSLKGGVSFVTNK